MYFEFLIGYKNIITDQNDQSNTKVQSSEKIIIVWKDIHAKNT